MSKATQEKIDHLRNLKTEERYTIKGLISDSVYDIYHLPQKSFIFTAWQLTFRPGDAIIRVIKGFRLYLYNSLEYLAFIGAIIVILNSRYHFFKNSYTQIHKHLAFFEKYGAFLKHFFEYSEEYSVLVNIVAIPVFSIVCFIFFFRNQYNIAEILIMNTYIAAQQMLYLLLLVPFLEFLPGSKSDYIIPVYFVATMLYNIWAYVQFFKGNLAIAALKAFCIVQIGYLLQFPVNMAVYYVINPFLKYLDFFN